MIDITLAKVKYRRPGRLLHREKIDPPEGTWVYNAGRFGSRPRTNPARKKGETLRPRMKAYWGNVLRG